MAELTIAVDERLAHELHQEQAGGDEFRRLVSDLGLRLGPLHPGTTERELARWFHATGSDGDVEAAVERLRGHPGVEAAYIKPPDALP